MFMKTDGSFAALVSSPVTSSLITEARVLTLAVSCYCDLCDGLELDCDQQQLSFPLRLPAVGVVAGGHKRGRLCT